MFDHERSLVRKYQGRPFALLGVNEDGSRETLLKAQKKYDLNWRSWWDGDKFISAQWKVLGLPTLVLLDRNGTIRWRGEGAPSDFKPMENRIEQLVREAESEGGKQASLFPNRDR